MQNPTKENSINSSNHQVGAAFSLSPEQQEILDGVDRFAKRELYPLSRRMDDEEWWPEGIMRRFGELGYLGITIPESHGGQGADLLTSGLVLQAISRWNGAISLAWIAHDNLCLNNLFHHSNEDQRKRFVPKLCSGEFIGALGLTEPGAGSDALGSMTTTARREGDNYILNGRKIYITNGAIADVLLIYAKTSPEKGPHGISAFLVEKDFPGFGVAQKLVKMGFRGSQTAELVFDNCVVPARNRLGGEDEGLKIVMSGLDLERSMISPICLGICERALTLSIEYAKTRKQFGKPIAAFQHIQGKIAEIYAITESMRALTYRVLAEAGAMTTGDQGRGSIHALTAASVMMAANGMNRVLDEAVQIHGGSGYIWESEINRLFRCTKLLEIGAGTTEVRKMIIAGELLR